MRTWSLSILGKVILPYLILTLVIAVVGTYVVVNLVAGSLDERLTNQLLEAGRVVSDSLARREIAHLEVGRIVAFTRGLDQALQAHDRDRIVALAQPVATSLGAECLVVLDADGYEMLQVLKQNDGSFKPVTGQFNAAGWWIAQALLQGNNPNSLPKRVLGMHPLNQRYYYFTAIPVGLGGQVVGVIIIGTSFDTLLPYFKTTSLADVIIYLNGGEAIATTFVLQEDGNDTTLLQEFSIAPGVYDDALYNDDAVSGENIRIRGRWYRLAHEALRVGNDKLGVYAVALPLNFILQAGTTSRNTYSVFFTLTMVCVVLVGYVISKRITQPLGLLVHTSQAVAGGDLDQRTGLGGTDEIGILASTFDEMTERLSERTKELEKAYHALEQMDKTKSDFIEVAAHELRTPLTLIKGYAQLLEPTIATKSEALELIQGIVTGASRMHGIVNSMLDVTRIDAKELGVCPMATSMAKLLQHLQDEFEPALQERHLALTTIGLDSLPDIIVDPDLFYKVFYQLIVNAIKYTPDDGTITISGRLLPAQNQESWVELVVSDTGIGIDPAHHELIFEKFYQTGEVTVHSSGKTKFKGGGPGLGLAIARGIVLAHGGRIWVESEGHDEERCPGSRFYIHLPAGREHYVAAWSKAA
ncbi:MAG: HAMP domain-containing protein [Thermoflexales bacterium]|nr:HAMP domain-containing protein [Thermoflexales bacterium]